jgi:hypothetical protein
MESFTTELSTKGLEEVYENILEVLMVESFEFRGEIPIETKGDFERILRALPVPNQGPDHKRFDKFIEKNRVQKIKPVLIWSKK